MQTAQLSANVLPLMEEAFGFLVERYGFELFQTTEVPSAAWYRNGDRSIKVSFDLQRDAALEVHLEERAADEPQLITQLLAFTAGDAVWRDGVRDHETLHAEFARMRRYLTEYCEEFLLGDGVAFRTRYREALMVKRCRSLAMSAFYAGDSKRAAILYEVFREYWNDADREHHERAAGGAGVVSLWHAKK